jgi:hypothetical protein
LIQASFITQRHHNTCHILRISLLTCTWDRSTCGGPRVQSEQRAQRFVRGNKRPHQNDARENGTCQTRPGRLPRKRTLTVSMMAMVALLTLPLASRVMRSNAPQHTAMKHVPLEHERCPSSSRVVERPPRPPPSDKDGGGEGSPPMRHRTQHQRAATRPSVFVREHKDPAKMPYSGLNLVERD